jgi:polysaccharide export outer membrane protein
MLWIGRGLAALATIGLLGGCALPRGAPLEREVLARGDDAQAGFAVYPVTRAFLPTFRAWPVPNERHLSWIGASPGSTARVIAPNDTIDLTIWDTDANSLLLRPGERQLAMPGMRVSSAGSIFLPYVGQVQISGTTPESARTRLQSALEPIAPSAQVQLRFSEGRQNSVEAVSGVARPGAYPLPDRSLTVLGLIALSGGVSTQINNPQVRLARGGRLYGTSLERLYEDPRLDTLLRPGDRLIVDQDDRYFLSLGAAGRQQVVPFEQERLTALDAMSRTGGLDSRRANPRGILILRDYPASAVAAGQRGPREERVVFVLDLTTADGLFSAGEFEIAPKDLVLVTESPVTAVLSATGLVGVLLGVTNQVSNIAE